MCLGPKLFGSTSGLRNVVVDLMLTVGTHNLATIGKCCMEEFKVENT